MKPLTAIIAALLVLGFTANSIAADKIQGKATGAAYLDLATRHRYLKNPDGTYMEFTQKGHLFRQSVPSDLPLLTTNRYIRQMGNTRTWNTAPSGLGFTSSVSTVSFDGQTLTATGAAYYDTATGHKYVKNPDGTYAEFTRKGDLFRRSVSSHTALLTTNKYIRDLGKNCYLIYGRTVNRQPESMILPSTKAHPEGWKCRELLITMR